MKIWSLERDKGVPEVYFERFNLVREINRNGIDSIHLGKVFRREFESNIVPFQLVASDGKTVLLEQVELPDLLFWSWVPIFSGRAKEMACSLGCDFGDWIECGFLSNLDRKFFLHLPTENYDIMDLKQSVFRMFIPANPDVPHGIKSLVLKTPSQLLPPCFRAAVPGNSQSFSEFLVRQDFHDLWMNLNFSGANFRQVAF